MRKPSTEQFAPKPRDVGELPAIGEKLTVWLYKGAVISGTYVGRAKHGLRVMQAGGELVLIYSAIWATRPYC